MSPGRIVVAATTFACMALLSAGWSEQRGVSLSIASAQAEGKNAQASKRTAAGSQKRMAASSQRYDRRVVRGYGPNPVAVGAGLAAGAIGTVDAMAAAPFGGAYAAGPGWDSGYYSPSTWGDHDCSPGFAGCRPYASKDWRKP
jgi:hypothetical protein